MSNPTGKGGFQERKHQINKKGRPKDIPGLRTLVQSVLNEAATTKDGAPLVVNGHAMTVVEAMLRRMIQSKNPRDAQIVLEYAYGKVSAPVELSGKDGGPVEQVIRFEWVDDNNHDDTDATAA